MTLLPPPLTPYPAAKPTRWRMKKIGSGPNLGKCGEIGGEDGGWGGLSGEQLERQGVPWGNLVATFIHSRTPHPLLVCGIFYVHFSYLSHVDM